MMNETSNSLDKNGSCGDSLKQLAEDLNRADNYKKLGYYFPTPSCA